ncbi:MAG: M23 family metallopeptidase [Endomicrobiales bacterium]|nr:M23 family metallopeptidase [Endomicrobiales bacterium]
MPKFGPATRKTLLMLFVPAILAGVFSCGNRNEPIKIAKTVTLNMGDTLDGSLGELELPPRARYEITKAFSSVFPPSKCKAGDHYDIILSTANEWFVLTYCGDGLDYYRVENTSSGPTASKLTKKAKTTIEAASGIIKNSLWESMTGEGYAADLIVDFADIFAWQIDFLTEPRNGDTYRIVWEKITVEDGRVMNGQILAAQYVASGETYTALYYSDKKGNGGYFAPSGKSLESAFLRAPLQYRRISSYFSRKRFHPILKYYRPHLGIDYAAPIGTPVSALGDGTVTFAGRKGGFGKYITIRHANGYTSSYGHLHGYAKGIRHGKKVKQGQVIGYVGSTGLSTGPHLDFRMTKNGAFINPLKLRFASKTQIPKNEMNRFTKTKKELLTKLAQCQ